MNGVTLRGIQRLSRIPKVCCRDIMRGVETLCLDKSIYWTEISSFQRRNEGHGYLIKKSNGDVWQTDMWQAGMGLVGFTNPKAVVWYQEKLKTLLDISIDFSKADFGERIPVKGYCSILMVLIQLRCTIIIPIFLIRRFFDLLVHERGEGGHFSLPVLQLWEVRNSLHTGAVIVLPAIHPWRKP